MLPKLLAPFHTLGAIVLAPLAIALLYAVLRVPAVSLWVQRQSKPLVRSLAILAVAFAAFFLIADFATVGQQHPFLDDESPVLSVAAAWLHGQPMYPALNAPVEYSGLYGPFTFLLFAPPILLHAVSLAWFQAWVALALTAMMILAYLALRRVSGRLVAVLALGYYVSALGLKAANAWSNKGDPWLLLFVAIAFWAALRLRPAVAEVVIAVCGAVLIDLKATTVLLALVPLLFLQQRASRSPLRRLGPVALMAALALAVFLLPGISLSNYRAALGLASRHGISGALLGDNLLWCLRVLLLPLAAGLWLCFSGDPQRTRQYLRRRRALLAMLALATLAIAISGAKHGAGSWHLLPLALPYALLTAELWAGASVTPAKNLALRLAPALWIFGSLAIHGIERTADAVHTRFHDDNPMYSNNLSYPDVERDMLQVLAAHPGDTLQVGVAASPEYNVARMRHLLILEGQPLFLDANTRDERDAAHVPVSPEVLDALRSCRITLWLIPRGDPPFSMQSGYGVVEAAEGVPNVDIRLYPESFVTLFRSSYHLTGSSKYFDLWACNHKPATP